MNNRILSALILALFAFTVFTSDAVAGKWWERHDEGWFFYNPEDRPKPELLKYELESSI